MIKTKEYFRVTCHMISDTWINYLFVWGRDRTYFTCLDKSSNRRRNLQWFLILREFYKVINWDHDRLTRRPWRGPRGSGTLANKFLWLWFCNFLQYFLIWPGSDNSSNKVAWIIFMAFKSLLPPLLFDFLLLSWFPRLATRTLLVC